MERSGGHRKSRDLIERLKQTSSSHLPAADTVWIAGSMEMLTTGMDRGNTYLLSTVRFGRILSLSDLCLTLGLFHDFSPIYKLKQEQCYWFCRLVLDLALMADPQAFVQNEQKSKRAGKFGNITVGQSSITSQTFRDTYRALMDLALAEEKDTSKSLQLNLVTRALKFPSDETKSRAARALATLINTHPPIRLAIAGTDAIRSLVTMLSSPSEFIQRDAATVMIAAVDSCLVNQEEARMAGAFSALVPLLYAEPNLSTGAPSLRSLASYAIALIVSHSPLSQKAALAEGVVPALHRLLGVDGSECHTSAIKTLAILVTSEWGKAAGFAADMLFPLFDLRASTSSALDVREYATSCIENMTCGATQNTMSTLVELLRSSRHNAMAHALRKIVQLTKSRNGALLAVSEDAIPPLIKLLSSSFTQINIQWQAALAITDIVFYDEGSTTALRAGALSPLVRLLSSHSSPVQHQAALAIGHITSFTTDNSKVLAVEAGALPLLIKMLSSSQLNLQTAALRAIAFISTVNTGRYGASQSDIVPHLVISLSSEHSDINQYAATIAANIASSDVGKETLLQWGAVPLLVKLLSSSSPVALEQAILAIARIAEFPSGTLAIMDEGGLPLLTKFCTSPLANVTQRATEAITNMISISIKQVRPVHVTSFAGAQLIFS
jgi:HEAT repeat protein